MSVEAKAKAEEYLRRAEEAERQAEAVTNYAAKQLYLNVASQWRELAEQAEKRRW